MTFTFASPVRREQSPAGAERLRVAAPTSTFLRQRALPWGLMTLGVALAVFEPALTFSYGWAPFLISLFLFGMPHGAMDWAVRNRLSGTSGLGPCLIGFLPYLAWMALSILLLVLLPIATVAAFMVLTIVHFGTADLFATGRVGFSALRRNLFILGRGCLVLGPAFAFHPQAAWAPFALLIGQPEPTGSFLLTLEATGLCVMVFGTVLAVSEATLPARGRPLLALHELVETVLILALGILASPLFAIGLFFLSTHAYRHSVRLASEPMSTASDGEAPLPRRLLRMHLDCLPLLVPTFAIIPVWSYLQFGRLDPYALVCATIGFFVISTLPHHLLGLRLPDFRP